MKTKRIFTLTLTLVLLLSLLTGCGITGGDSAEAETVTIEDHGGNSVTLPAQIDRVAVVGIWPLPSVISVFFNSAHKLTAIPEASMTAAKNGLLGQLYPEILNADTGFMNGDDLNAEELLKLDPQVVFYNVANAQYGDQLRDAGLNAVALNVNGYGYNAMETLNHWIELLSQIFPASDKAEAMQKRSQEIYDLVQTRVSDLTEDQRARVFFLFQYSDTAIATSGARFFGQWWCDAIGAVNVAGDIDKDNAAPVNMEQIYAWNPDTILITNYNAAAPEDLYTNAIGSNDWSGIDAVMNKNVFKMPLGMYRAYTPGADTPITLLWMAKAVYPALFEDIDVTQEARDYYKDIFGIELTDEQVEAIFAPSAEASVGTKLG